MRNTLLLCLTLFSLQARGELKVVATIPDLASIASAVGGNRVSVSSIASGLEDPHFVEAKPSFMTRLRSADLFLVVGMELEKAWAVPLMQGARNPKIQDASTGYLDCSVGVPKLEVPTGNVDRSMGDIHPYGNPHYWLDPWAGRVAARSIRDRLIRLDPAGKSTYDANYSRFVDRLDDAMFGTKLAEIVGGEKLWAMLLKGTLDAWLKQNKHFYGGWMAEVREVSGTKIVTYHRSWSYFAKRFGFEVVEELEPKPGIAPSPGHVLDVINAMKRVGAKVVLMEPFYARKAADLVAQKVGGAVVQAANSVGGQKEAKDYISMIGNVVRRVVAAAK